MPVLHLLLAVLSPEPPLFLARKYVHSANVNARSNLTRDVAYLPMP